MIVSLTVRQRRWLDLKNSVRYHEVPINFIRKIVMKGKKNEQQHKKETKREANDKWEQSSNINDDVWTQVR